MRWFFRPSHPPPVQAYLDNTRARVPRRTPVGTLNFAVVDTETTGLDPQRDRMLSVAIMPVCGGRIHLGDSAVWLVRQPIAPLNDAVLVHGILPTESSTEGRPEAEAVEELLPRLAGAVLVAHHVNFDFAMLDQALRRHHGIPLRNPRLDTAALAMRSVEAFARTGYRGQRPPSMEEVCAQCSLEPVDRHTAAGDAFTTAQLLLLLLARLQRRLGRPAVAGDLPLG